ncbi:MAG TPA: methylated-DNA--[protein]-cysteine S-methyltransferase [Methylobacter sp.]|jgi:AraC family transcriptional regulator of adaptative response/methylated-DNA-[protein]-cysteine methyltransferase
MSLISTSDYRANGSQSRIRFALGECSLGSVLVAVSAKGICTISLGDGPEALTRDLQNRFPQAELIGSDGEFEQWIAQITAFVETPALGLDLPLDICGTAFQQRVWHALRQIPAGQTVSYTDIAQRMGAPKAVRAVAGACAANSLAVVIPCHRVLRSDGNLSGYRWGIERKAELLRRESKA